MSVDEEIENTLENIMLPIHIKVFSQRLNLRFYSKIIEYVNRTECRKYLFVQAIGKSAEEIISLFTIDLVNYYADYINVYDKSSLPLREVCLKLITSYYDHLSQLVLKSEISESQLKFMIGRINLCYKPNKIEKMLSNVTELKLIIKYKKYINNNPKQITILLQHMCIPNEIFENIEEYYNAHRNKSKYNLFLRMKQHEIAYEKLATFVETLDNYRKDTEDDSDIIITSKALNSALEVVHEFSRNDEK